MFISARLGYHTVMFDGFALERIDVGEVVLRVRHGGADSPVLLLHGVIQLLAGAPELVSRYRHMETLGKYEHALGENHPDTVSVRTELAHRYSDAGRFDEAIPLFVHVLADHERVLGSDHPETVRIRNNLDVVRSASGESSG